MNQLLLNILFTLLLPLSISSRDTLTLHAYLDIVTSNHPLIKKADLYDEIRTAYNLKGRGVLDPKIVSDYKSKEFKETDYYTTWQSEVKIPTILPIDVSLGYERNDGLFLNPENSVPSNGLVYGTLNIDLLRGLLFDEQRYQIQQASLDGAKNQIEKEILVREILHQAIGAYLEWTTASQQLDIYENYFSLVQIRHQNIVQLFLNGDKPAIDTTESRLNLNYAEKDRLLGNDYLIKKKQKLSLFIWDTEGQPLQIKEQLNPMRLNILVSELKELATLLDPNFNEDPYSRKIANEIASLELDNRLEREQLKPKVNLKYNTIVNLGDNELSPAFTFRDYKYGISLHYPILNRKTRGNLKLNKALIDQSHYDKTSYIGKLNNTYHTLISRTGIQMNLIQVSEENIRMSQQLYEAEQIKFELGESYIFLLNQRERKLLDSRLQLIKHYGMLGGILNEMYYFKLGQN